MGESGFAMPQGGDRISTS